MKTQTQPTHTAQSRRARAIYNSQRRCGPVAGLVATQIGLLAVVALAVACVIGLRGWLSF